MLDLISGATMLLLPCDRLLSAPDDVTRLLLRGAFVDAGGLALLSAALGVLALRWLPTQPAQALTVATGLGVFMIAMAMLHTSIGGGAALLYDGTRGLALLGSIAYLTMRRAPRTTAGPGARA